MLCEADAMTGVAVWVGGWIWPNLALLFYTLTIFLLQFGLDVILFATDIVRTTWATDARPTWAGRLTRWVVASRCTPHRHHRRSAKQVRARQVRGYCIILSHIHVFRGTFFQSVCGLWSGLLGFPLLHLLNEALDSYSPHTTEGGKAEDVRSGEEAAAAATVASTSVKKTNDIRHDN